jgi:glycosyltransferase involved in cell wall biosynthesis
MMQTRMTLVGELTSLSGYGQHLIRTFRYFQEHGVFVSVRPIKSYEKFGAGIPTDIKAHIVNSRQPEEWELLIAHPTQTPTPGRKTIYFTMWESSEPPGNVTENLNAAETIIVPCEWNRECFERRGIRPQIHLVPLGYDHEIYKYTTPSGGKKTVFAAAGRTANGRDRKGLDGVVRSFLAAFPYDENVRLRIKCHDDCKIPHVTDPRIEVVRAHLSETDVAKFLAESHCFVSAATGEGWGLWQLQAMAAGRPVIAAVYGGLKEFMGDNNSYPVKYREANSSEHWGGFWAQPDLESVIAQMRRVHADREEAVEIGKAAERSVRRYTWDRSCGQLHEIMDAYGATPILTHSNHVHIKIESVAEQCRRKVWPVSQFEFELGAGEVVFNPSTAGGKWFFRSSFDTDGNKRKSRIFATDGRQRAAMKDRLWLDLVGCQGDEFEDPRAILHEGEIAVSYTRLSAKSYPTQEIVFLNPDLSIRDVWHPPIGGNGSNPRQSSNTEKNWVWFNYNGAWHCIHWLEPMQVYRVENGLPVEKFESYKPNRRWLHGLRHGGAHPTRIGDEYFGFCHSVMPWFGRDRSRYYISCYAFAAKPPFQMTRLARVPILESDDDVRANLTPCSCVIVGGAEFKGGTWVLAAGVRDEASLRIELRHDRVLESMDNV